MVERFNRRIEKAPEKRKLFLGEFKTKKELFDFTVDTTERYNSASLQCLHYRTPP
jgi:hypothetical protein